MLLFIFADNFPEDQINFTDKFNKILHQIKIRLVKGPKENTVPGNLDDKRTGQPTIEIRSASECASKGNDTLKENGQELKQAAQVQYPALKDSQVVLFRDADIEARVKKEFDDSVNYDGETDNYDGETDNYDDETDDNNDDDDYINEEDEDRESKSQLKDAQSNSDKKFKCKTCGRAFRKKWNMEMHEKCHANLREFKCTKCDLRFNTKGCLASHLRRHEVRETSEDDKKHECRHCGKRFKKRYNMTIHERIHGRQVKCTQCDRTFISQGYLKKHMNKKHWTPNLSENNEGQENSEDDWIYGCQSCNRGFKTKSDLEVHEKLHEQLPDVKYPDDVLYPVKCNICHKIFKTGQYLAQHMHHHVAKIYPCMVCGRLFTRKYWKCHVKNCGKEKIERERNHKCTECDKCFYTERMLREHIRNVHERVKDFACEYCGFRCGRKGNMKAHMQTHLNERKHKCHLCGKGFNWPQSLKSHISDVHERIRNFTCDICGKSWARKPNMIAHRKSHSTVRMYKCKRCGEAFISVQLRREHLNSAHEKLTFTCEFCGKVFNRKDLLTRHVKRMHKAKQEHLPVDKIHVPPVDILAP